MFNVEQTPLEVCYYDLARPYLFMDLCMFFRCDGNEVVGTIASRVAVDMVNLLAFNCPFTEESFGDEAGDSLTMNRTVDIIYMFQRSFVNSVFITTGTFFFRPVFFQSYYRYFAVILMAQNSAIVRSIKSSFIFVVFEPLNDSEVIYFFHDTSSFQSS